MIDISIMLGLIMLFISLAFFIVQALNSSYMKEEQLNKYNKTSKIQKENRTNEEQNYVEQTWKLYYIQKIKNISFIIGIVLMPLLLFKI